MTITSKFLQWVIPNGNKILNQTITGFYCSPTSWAIHGINDATSAETPA